MQSENLAYAIGVQTYISYFPLMDLYRTLWETCFDPGRGHDRTLNEYFAFDRLITSEDDWVITPNNDTIYLRAFLDLRKEPIILVIPPMGDRHFWVPVSDLRHDHDASLSWDTIGARGGAYALCPPGWQGVLPKGVQRVDVGTPIVWTLPRIAVNGEADLPAALELQKQFRLVPLSQWGATTVTRPQPDAADFPRFTRHEHTDARAYFTTLNKVLRLAARLCNPADAVMAAWMRELKLDPASSFDWDQLSPEAQRGLERAAADAHQIIADRMPRAVAIVNNWQVVRLEPRISGDPLLAAAAAMLGLMWNPAKISTYDIAFLDGTGAPLDGNNRYVLRFAPPPPVEAFWSVSMYSAESGIFVSNKINRYSLGDRTPGLRVRRGRLARDLPAGRRARRSGRAGELAASAQGALLPCLPALLAAFADPDRRLGAAAGGQALIRPPVATKGTTADFFEAVTNIRPARLL
ncbi:MAG: DUF1254 domain-containing protein [Caldilineales bacterium]|nr:DUF1254 domain-containing protein [Caldilineales bacterium]MDW8317138.1 DUF1254 domain-containing protein [Anaerolineae bacterium]